MSFGIQIAGFVQYGSSRDEIAMAMKSLDRVGRDGGLAVGWLKHHVAENNDVGWLQVSLGYGVQYQHLLCSTLHCTK
jgi:hypothetical protein